MTGVLSIYDLSTEDNLTISVPVKMSHCMKMYSNSPFGFSVVLQELFG